MYCQKCGKLISEDGRTNIKFCPICGAQQQVNDGGVNTVTPTATPTASPTDAVNHEPQRNGINDQYTHTVDISGKSIMSSSEIVTQIIESEFAKKGLTSETAVLRGLEPWASQIIKKKNKDNTIVFWVWEGFAILNCFGGGVGVIIAAIITAINLPVYIKRIKKLKEDRETIYNNIGYIMVKLQERPDVPIGQIVAEEMARI